MERDDYRQREHQRKTSSDGIKKWYEEYERFWSVLLEVCTGKEEMKKGKSRDNQPNQVHSEMS